jgi:hypothetical protein
VANLKLKRISSSTHAKVIETGNGGYVLGHREPVKYRTYDPKQEQFLDGIFKSEDFMVRNATGNPEVDDLNEFDINVKGPEGEYSDFFQYENFAVGIKQETLTGIANYNFLTSAYELEPELIPIYERPEGVYDDDYFNSLSAPRFYLSALPYAYITELPLNKIVYDFDNGVIFGDSISLKNPYDYKYDLSITETSAANLYEFHVLSGSLTIGSSSDNFGRAVSLDGDRILIGTPGEDPPSGATNAGVAYIFDLSGSTWNETQILSGSLAAGSTADNFGRAVSLDGNRALVGAYQEDPDGLTNAGVAYIFDLSGSTWVETQLLSGSLASSSDNFGFSVSLDGDRCLIGANFEDPAGGDVNAGVAYIFDLSGSTWVESQILSGSLGSGGSSSDQFGYSVSLDGDRCLIGALNEDPAGAATNAGAAYIFDLVGSTWTETQVLTGSLPAVDVDDKFGESVSLDGDRAIVGAPQEDLTGGTRAGVAYIFDLSGSTWVETQLLSGSLAVGNDDDLFGRSVSLYGDRVIIGAPGEDPAGGSNSAGVVYVFTLSGSTWVENQIISGSLAVGNAFDNLGNAVSLNESRAVFGSPFEDPFSVTNAGVAYVLDDVPSAVINLQNTRDYDKGGLDKNDAWLSYRTESNWVTISPISANTQFRPLEPTVDSTDPFYSYQQIERIRGFNRLAGAQSLHKSNIFSIRIRNTNLNEAIEDEDLRNDIQAAINTVIREVIDKISPANTQLWKIIWSGD